LQFLQSVPTLLPTASAQAAVAVVILIDVAADSRAWGFSRYVIGRFSLQGVPGLRFFKVLGSGRDGGFGLRPSSTHQGLFCLFDDDQAADRFLEHSRVAEAYRSHARECFSVKLRAFSSRGSWSGRSMAVSVAAPGDGPIAALTRASIHPSRAWRFWQKAPPAERDLVAAPGCLLAAGLGEAPVLRQATFSLWQDVASMDRYARSGAHLEAIRAAHQGQYFSESMFVRFVPYAPRGAWKGFAPGAGAVPAGSAADPEPSVQAVLG
jgi:spheroidene monooxygenase